MVSRMYFGFGHICKTAASNLIFSRLDHGQNNIVIEVVLEYPRLGVGTEPKVGCE